MYTIVCAEATSNGSRRSYYWHEIHIAAADAERFDGYVIKREINLLYIFKVSI